MSYLTLDADRLVRDAVEAFLVGRLRPDALPDTVYATKNSRYRIMAGLVHEASDTSLMGAELVGWLLEESGSARVEPRWRTNSRGVFVERKSGHVVVTSRVLTRSVVSESGRPRAGMLNSIPPAPPIPQLKQSPSIAPPSLISMGAPDPRPVLRSSRPPMPSDEEVTKVERTEVADLDELDALREISANILAPPALDISALPPPPDDLDAETRPVIAELPPDSRRSQPPPAPNGIPAGRPSPRLVPPRAQSNRPPPRPSSKRNAPPAAGSKRGVPPPAPSTKRALPPPAPSSKRNAQTAPKPLPPPNPPPRKAR